MVPSSHIQVKSNLIRVIRIGLICCMDLILCIRFRLLSLPACQNRLRVVGGFVDYPQCFRCETSVKVKGEVFSYLFFTSLMPRLTSRNILRGQTCFYFLV